jgi:hypothetical protein
MPVERHEVRRSEREGLGVSRVHPAGPVQRCCARHQAQRDYRGHPGEPVKVFYLPRQPTNCSGIGTDDPGFGETFYTGSFNDGFEHADTRVTVPVAQMTAKPGVPGRCWPTSGCIA